MQVIAVTGGKGGTGKSTFSILYSSKLFREGEKIVLCDADVECPNDHLLIGVERGKPEPVFRSFPLIEPDKCIKCGLCVEKCRFHALFQVPGEPPTLLKHLCTSCGLCWSICPVEAIDKFMEEIGRTYSAKVDNGFWLVTGESKVGVEETGPIVKETKRRALRLAEEIGVDKLIVDTAPGTHCNVIYALIGSEKAFIVTEPTPLGAHDLKLIHMVLEALGIPAEIVLNKADLGRKEIIKRIADDLNLRITVEIPYSIDLVKAYAGGRLREVDLF